MSVLFASSSVDSFYRNMHSLTNSFATWINSSVHTFELQSIYSNDTLPRASTHQCTRSNPESILREPNDSTLHPSTPQSTPQTHSSTQLPNMRTRTHIRVPVWILTQLFLFTHRLINWLIRLHSTHQCTLIDSSDSRLRLHIDSRIDSFNSWTNWRVY